jgi:hypothetical protein
VTITRYKFPERHIHRGRRVRVVERENNLNNIAGAQCYLRKKKNRDPCHTKPFFRTLFCCARTKGSWHVLVFGSFIGHHRAMKRYRYTGRPGRSSLQTICALNRVCIMVGGTFAWLTRILGSPYFHADLAWVGGGIARVTLT